MANIERDAAEGIALRVMTWNVRGSRSPRISRLAGVVAANDPDVLALQEVQARQARGLARALGGRHVRWVAKHRPPFLPGVLGRRWTEGLAVLTKNEVVGYATATLSDGVPFGSFRRRVAQDVVVDVDGVTLRVVNVHLSSDDADDRVTQTRRLVELLDAPPEDAPDVRRDRTLLMGDLNAVDESGVFGPLVEAGLARTWSVVGEGPGHTNPAHAPVQRLDHVLAGSSLLPVRASVIDVPDVVRSSDHLPVVVDLRLR